MKTIFMMVIISILLMFSNSSFAENSDKAHMVMVDLSPNKPVQKLFPLTVLSVDGEPIMHKDNTIMLEVGEHTLTFAANIDFNYLSSNDKILRTQINQRKYSDTLALNVEAGKTYQLAFDARPVKVEDWKPIVLGVSEK
ncbi:hypothetical protein [Marinicella gelatinilytica]|uniref:hypothetical protein n=1 Tax=Marinicella gelatinilytica TaxID=2996017 RepID=UPI002260A8BB|nr:hypothetical protein [Marinicella gelatinilytica]MCX7545400.1 hypothetical protein [Marinicella gelatinilytica]